MQISIDNQIANYLINKLRGDTYWCAGKVLKEIENGFKQDKIRLECKHKFGIYIGKKKCCVKCGGLSEGISESWTLKSKK